MHINHLIPFVGTYLHKINDFVSIGMLSKSKGQLLTVAVVMHVLFNMDDPSSIPQEISEDAVRAADCFVDLCLQHAAYLVGGKGNLQEAIDEINKDDYTRLHI